MVRIPPDLKWIKSYFIFFIGNLQKISYHECNLEDLSYCVYFFVALCGFFTEERKKMRRALPSRNDMYYGIQAYRAQVVSLEKR